ncbi:CLUMA_CG001342, isoform A [Clunio marinus]|uniref:CLUMA_CG001342, isoform A n=1 Tax=Clunio marinus TaxID=568069 RepID=A0A1J1HMT2_9DIPT|nr:CLUMA_CG001342, isoform A [Clunio marinus]
MCVGEMMWQFACDECTRENIVIHVLGKRKSFKLFVTLMLVLCSSTQLKIIFCFMLPAIENQNACEILEEGVKQAKRKIFYHSMRVCNSSFISTFIKVSILAAKSGINHPADEQEVTIQKADKW